MDGDARHRQAPTRIIDPDQDLVDQVAMGIHGQPCHREWRLRREDVEQAQLGSLQRAATNQVDGRRQIRHARGPQDVLKPQLAAVGLGEAEVSANGDALVLDPEVPVGLVLHAPGHHRARGRERKSPSSKEQLGQDADAALIGLLRCSSRRLSHKPQAAR